MFRSRSSGKYVDYCFENSLSCFGRQLGPGTVLGNAGDVFLVRGLARGWVAECGMNNVPETGVRNAMVAPFGRIRNAMVAPFAFGRAQNAMAAVSRTRLWGWATGKRQARTNQSEEVRVHEVDECCFHRFFNFVGLLLNVGLNEAVFYTYLSTRADEPGEERADAVVQLVPRPGEWALDSVQGI